MTNIEAVVHSIAVCYPTESLSRQVAHWRRARGLRDRAGLRPVGLGDSPLVERRRHGWSTPARTTPRRSNCSPSRWPGWCSVRRGLYGKNARGAGAVCPHARGLAVVGPLGHRQWEEFFASMLPPRREAMRRAAWPKAA